MPWGTTPTRQARAVPLSQPDKRQPNIPYDKFCDQSITWQNRGVNIPPFIINKEKIGKKAHTT